MTAPLTTKTLKMIFSEFLSIILIFVLIIILIPFALFIFIREMRKEYFELRNIK